MEFEIEGMVFVYCAPKPSGHFKPFWFINHPSGSGHLMFFCPGTILYYLPLVREWWTDKEKT